MSSVSEPLLPDRIIQWIEDALGPNSTVESSRRLEGGTSSSVHQVNVRVNGLLRNCVLRQFDNAEWLADEPDLARNEAQSLRFATQIGVPTPRLVAFDETGDSCGVPTVLMTLLDGSVVLEPPQMNRWLNGLAAALVQIHSVPADTFPWTYFTYANISSLQVPAWSRHPELWKQAIEIVNGPQPIWRSCFIHRDYHPTNVLWSKNAVSGVVDWVNACRGPAGIDVGHCRVNLALLYDVATADEFLAAYLRSAESTFSYDPYWDLVSLIDISSEPPSIYPGWTAFGVRGLTDDLILEHQDAYLVSLINRFSDPNNNL